MRANNDGLLPARYLQQISQELKYRGLYKGPGRILTLLLVTGLLLGGCRLTPGRSASASDNQSAVVTSDTGEPAAVSPTPAPTLAPTPSPSPAPTKPPAPTSALPPDALSEKYFGPLPIPEQASTLQHNELRGLYVGAAGNLEANLAIARETEVNALVIDLKESDGIWFSCSVPLAVEIGAVKPAYDLKAVVERCHADGVKVIGRIVCFKDPLLAKAKPEYCISDQAGKRLIFNNEGSQPFVSPYNQEVWQYNIDIALDAVKCGVDEIQFDYVRFPTGSAKGGSKPYFGPEGQVPDRTAAINRFLQTARIRIQDEGGIPLGADVFAIIVTSSLDGQNIGQSWPTIGLTGIDSVCPMIYPSHYANSSAGHYTGNGKGTYLNGVLYPKPDLKPYEVMYNVLALGKEATDQAGYATNRPWLQAFTASYLPEGYYMTYGAKEIRAQIKAIQDAGYQEWICWNAAAVYSASAFDAED